MSTKTIWITAFDKAQDAVRVAALSQVLKRYGLATQGHFWIDEPDKLAWRAGLDALNATRADVWLIVASHDALAKPSIRYGLSLFAASLRDARGAAFPIVLSAPGAPDTLGVQAAWLANAPILDETAAAWPAKIVAKANAVSAAPAPDYRLAVLGEERLGQWFSIGPRRGEWQGVIFGVHGSDAKIDFQAVGRAGMLPEKTTLEYAQEGLTLQVGGRAFTAWAVRNTLVADDAYYARVAGSPQAVLFMPYAEGDDAEATVVELI